MVYENDETLKQNKNKNIKNYLSTNLRYLRLSKSKTLKDIAILLNKSEVAAYYYETGAREPNAMDLYKLSEYYNIDIDNLLTKDLSINNVNFIEPDEDTINIPVLGRIPAGVPFEAIEDVIKYIDVPKEWTYGNKEYFGLLIDGNSMFPKYQNEDIVIFQKCEDPIKCNNKDCAVMVNGNDATFKKFIFNNNGVILQPYNMEYETKSFTPEEVQELPIKLVGFAVQIRRDL